MKAFAFKLEPLLKLRRNQRDLCRQLLAEVLRREEDLVAQRHDIEANRNRQLDELREFGAAGREVNVDRSSARRFYAGQLIGDMGGIERQRALVAQQIALCRMHLVKADQSVKMLEKLADKQRAEFQLAIERKEARELDECRRPPAGV